MGNSPHDLQLFKRLLVRLFIGWEFPCVLLKWVPIHFYCNQISASQTCADQPPVDPPVRSAPALIPQPYEQLQLPTPILLFKRQNLYNLMNFLKEKLRILPPLQSWSAVTQQSKTMTDLGKRPFDTVPCYNDTIPLVSTPAFKELSG